jgi:hypothetical protein
LQEPLLEVLVLSTVLEAVQSALDPSLQESVKDLADGPRAMGLGFMLPLGHGLASMVPVLEGLGHVQIHDPLGDLENLPSELSIIEVVFPDGLKACAKELCVPLLGQLLGPLSHVDGDLSSLEPLSERLSLLEELHVLLENLLLDSELLQDLGHLDEVVVASSKFLRLDDPDGTLVLGSDDVGHALIVGFKCVGIVLLHLKHALDALSVGVLPPGDHSLSEQVVLDKPVEVVHLPASILIQIVLSGHESDPLEHLHPESLSGDGANDIDGILLLLDVVSPHEQDVASLVDVVVLSHSTGQGVEGLLEVLVQLLLQSSLLSDLVGQLFSFLGMGSLLSLSLLLE